MKRVFQTLLIFLVFAIAFLPKGCGMAMSADMERDCFLCGTGGLVNYYQKQGLLGIVSLTSGQVFPLEPFVRNEDGSLSTNSNQLFYGDGKGSGMSRSVYGNRGICSLRMYWEPSKPFQMSEINKGYCQECVEKIREMVKADEERYPERERCPFLLIDCVTGDLYSPNGHLLSMFVRDYYVMLDYKKFEDGEISGVVFYAPEREEWE